MKFSPLTVVQSNSAPPFQTAVPVTVCLGQAAWVLEGVWTFVYRGNGFFSPADVFHSSVPDMQIACGWINNLLPAVAGQ